MSTLNLVSSYMLIGPNRNRGIIYFMIYAMVIKFMVIIQVNFYLKGDDKEDWVAING